MKHKIAFWSYSRHLVNRIIPSIKNNKKIIPVAIFSQKIDLIKNNEYLKKNTGFYLIENLGSVVNLVHKS